MVYYIRRKIGEWYNMSIMINEINYIEIANKPANFEYFILFSEIIGVNIIDYYKFILLRDGIMRSLICGKVFIGETLKEAILRELRSNFGVEEILDFNFKLGKELVKNRFGVELNRIHVTIKINKDQIKKPNLGNLIGKWEWLERIYPKLSDEIFNSPTKFRYFVKFKIYYIESKYKYFLKIILNGDYEDWIKNKKYFSNAFDYNGEVLLGETLEDSINRELKEKFEIEKIIDWKILSNVDLNQIESKSVIPITGVEVRINKEDIKDLNFKGFAKIIFNKVKIEILHKTDYVSIKSNLIKYSDFGKDRYKMEALEYFKYGGLLAGNRFDSIEKAEVFVKKLYKLGAEKTEVVRIEEYEVKGIKLFGSDSLKVKLPSDKEKRAKILKIANNESRREGLINKKSEEDKDIGQEFTGFGWD